MTSFSNLSSTEAKLHKRSFVKALELNDIAFVLVRARNVVHEEPFIQEEHGTCETVTSFWCKSSHLVADFRIFLSLRKLRCASALNVSWGCELQATPTLNFFLRQFTEIKAFHISLFVNHFFRARALGACTPRCRCSANSFTNFSLSWCLST